MIQWATGDDAPGFYGYLGGGRFLRDPPTPINSSQRAMFEFMPYDEDCPPGCHKCKPASWVPAPGPGWRP